MNYERVIRGIFESRPNRFIARVWVDGSLTTVHVKNTGRCRELLVPGREVVLSVSENPCRKTAYDLVAVEKPGLGLVNIDSQAPNRAVGEWLARGDWEVIRPEYPFGDSRLDFYLSRGGHCALMEVKGCTLEVDGIGYFPDAPTARGAKHLRELTRASGQGYACYIAFVIQMPGVTEVRPNISTDPAFARALDDAVRAGVRLLCLPCAVTAESLTITAERLLSDGGEPQEHREEPQNSGDNGERSR